MPRHHSIKSTLRGRLAVPRPLCEARILHCCSHLNTEPLDHGKAKATILGGGRPIVIYLVENMYCCRFNNCAQLHNNISDDTPLFRILSKLGTLTAAWISLGVLIEIFTSLWLQHEPE